MRFDSFDEKNIDVELAEEKDPPKEQTKEEKYDNLNKNQQHKDNRLDNKDNDNNANANNKNKNQPNEKQGEPSEKQNHDYNTLDESVKATLNRDLTRIYYKLKHVLIPSFSSKKNEELQNWDLWGPLIICLALCIFLSVGRENDTNLTFIAIFIIMWLGGAIIAFNSIFLGGKIGICQSICLLGYCSFPMLVASVFVKIFSWAPPYARVIIVAITYIWSCFSSVGFMSGLVPPSKKFVAVYPVFLFYLTLSGFILNY